MHQSDVICLVCASLPPICQEELAVGKANKTRAQLETELKMLRSVKRSEGILSLGNNLIRWGALVLITRYAYLSIEAMAGKETFAGFFVNFLGNFDVSMALSWVVGGTGFLYGARQRSLRRDAIERLQGRITHLEKQIDPRRSSSNLTPRGDSRPEDVL